MKLRNVEVDFSFTNADDLERLEKASKKVQEKANKKEKEEMNLSTKVKEECKIINEFLDEVFGEGIAEKIFKGKNDLKEHMELFMDIMNEKINTTKSFQSLYDNIEYKAKYMPNRETRRYNNKHKGRK